LVLVLPESNELGDNEDDKFRWDALDKLELEPDFNSDIDVDEYIS
jgi:hypothetical protein